MSLLHHSNDRSSLQEDAKQIAKNTKIGIWLFLFYFVFYACFVLINAFVPTWMEWTPISGINMAVLSGMLLIALAVILAFVYGWLCRTPSSE